MIAHDTPLRSIAPEKLEAVRVILTHGSCPDGMASAILLRDAFLGKGIPIRFIQYGSEDHRNMTPEPGMLFCDITPPYERAGEFVAAGAIVLDHHRTARAIVEQFGENGIFADEAAEPGVCGAVLAYRHVWVPRRAGICDACRCLLPDESCKCPPEKFSAEFATLAGIRDTWQRKDPRWDAACAQASVLNFIPADLWLQRSLSQLAASWKADYEWLGRLLQTKQRDDVERMASKGWPFVTAKGTRVLVIPSKGLTSDVAELMDTAIDLLVGFGYTYEQGTDRPLLILSTRSHTTFDCGAFCKSFPGGGGHTKAAGCSFPVGKDDPNPYTIIEGLVRGHDAARP